MTSQRLTVTCAPRSGDELVNDLMKVEGVSVLVLVKKHIPVDGQLFLEFVLTMAKEVAISLVASIIYDFMRKKEKEGLTNINIVNNGVVIINQKNNLEEIKKIVEQLR